mmetsp:Transcript_33729/g.101859  ORF Transcript_33729/g.101859 Transcript_33729/m.101859 type:complete len:1630 (-) Transcript_33729:51-4940(-)
MLFAQRRAVRAGLAARQARALAALPRAPGKVGLYDPSKETENCGVGLVASLKKEPSRAILTDCNEMLVRMSHRGGCGCDPQSGDGAGMLVAMPDAFMRAHAPWPLPAQGDYAVSMCFLPQDEANAARSRASLERACRQRGLGMLGWRVLETDNSDLGEAPLASEPRVEQLFLTKPAGWSARKFEQELYRAQAVAQLENFQVMEEEGVGEDAVLYINSMSPHQITYKGQLTPEQVLGYFSGDLLREDFETHLALVHSRFSTNTFPSWSRAQPLRQMCHNGEINTLRGNKNWMRARQGLLRSPYLGDDTAKLLPVTSDEMSDSGNFDGVLQLLTNESEKSLPEAAMIMVPEAWQDNDGLSESKKAFYEYHSCLMEPWDGPALIAFTDSHKWIGATLDRNGLRPVRYYVTHDDRVLVSSEVGVIPWVTPDEIKLRSRLEPGKMFLVDLESGRVVPDSEIKETVAAAKPYGEWLAENRVFLSDWAKLQKPVEPAADFDDATTARRLVMHGYTTETMETLLAPMAIGGKEGFGSMGNDAALAVLSAEPRPVSDYFKQLFAQVTNPPIDPIREELVMSLVCPVGPESNLLDAGAENCARLVVEHPVLTPEELAALQDDGNRDGWSCATVDATFPRHGADLPPPDDANASSSDVALEAALASICEQAAAAVQGGLGRPGATILVLSDVLAGPDRLPVPTLLAVGAVHQHLLKTGQRGKAALFADAGDVKEVHDVALAVGFGADGVCPRVAYEALAKLNADGLVAARMRNDLKTLDDAPDDAELRKAYRKALAKGLLKVMSKMGISTLQSYKGAQIFEALGLHPDVVETCFSGTPSRIGGANFDALQRDVVALHDHAWGAATKKLQTDKAGAWTNVTHDDVPQLPNPGQFHYRNGGELHLNTPAGMTALQIATKANSRDTFRQYCDDVDAVNAKSTLRGILRWRPEALEKGRAAGLTLDEIEPAKEIVKRFVTGAMSLGSISRESHEALVVAMNALGGKSNTGEGGEDPVRNDPVGDKRDTTWAHLRGKTVHAGDIAQSAIRQVASGRFGVTASYLAGASQIEIKVAQGAKPGEGGQLPGQKVDSYIASVRAATEGVTLISPPPHHDIYSIEDLAQLIFDLKAVAPDARISVKLVSIVGIGTVACGVAKAGADVIQISGHDGGSGAAAISSIKHAGGPLEIGLAEVHTTLVENGLRDLVTLRADGGIRTGADVVKVVLLGAEEIGFGTVAMVAAGCVMARVCHTNNCPVGVATQKEKLRARVRGEPEDVTRYFECVADEVADILRSLGLSSLRDAVGRVDLLELADDAALSKTSRFDVESVVLKPVEWGPLGEFPFDAPATPPPARALLSPGGHHFDDRYVDATNDEDPYHALSSETHWLVNTDRAVGARLAGDIARRQRAKGVVRAVDAAYAGSAGQSFAAFAVSEMNIQLEGDANDYVGKGLSGAKVAIFPPRSAEANGDFVAKDSVIIGNTCLYGATSGKFFAAGQSGDRFGVRNSGVQAVIEGAGDHCCEYMTNGIVVVLGPTGINVGSGMTGGVAYLYAPDLTDDEVLAKLKRTNVEPRRVVDAASPAAQSLKSLLEQHVEATGSKQASAILAAFKPADFVQVIPPSEVPQPKNNVVEIVEDESAVPAAVSR